MTQPDKRFFIITTAIFAVILFLVQLFSKLIPLSNSILLWGSFTTLCILLSDNGQHRMRLVLASVLAGLLAAFINYYPAFSNAIAPSVVNLIGSLATLCFVQVWHKHNGFNPPYQNFYDTVWGNISLFILMVVFVGLCSLIVGLLTFLFSMIGLPGVGNVFAFASVYLVFASIGLFISLKIDTVTCALQKVLVLFSQALLPVLAVIGFLYAVIWAAMFSQVPQNSIEIMSFVFPVLGFFGIIFVNGAYESGQRYESFNRWYKASVPLLCFAVLVLGGTGLIKNPRDLNSVVICLLMFYALVYFICAITRYRNLSWLGKANIWLAALLILVAIDLSAWRLLHPQPKQAFFHPAKQSAPKTLVNAHLTWRSQVTSRFVFGYRDGKPLTFCRVRDSSKWIVGELNGGVCRYISPTKPKQSQNYLVLTGSGKATFNRRYDGRYTYVAVTGKPCRVIFNNRIYLGRTIREGCSIVVNGKDQTVYRSDVGFYLYGEVKK